MITREQLIAIGTVLKAHGLAGEMVVTPDVEPDVLQRLRCVVLDIDGVNVPFFPAGVRERGAASVLLTLDDVTAADVPALLGKTLYALKDEFTLIAHDDESDEAYPLDYFIGYTVMDAATGAVIGTVDEVDDATMNVLFIVTREDGSQVRLPAVDDLVTHLDDERRVIVMMLPGGILDL